MSTMKKAALGCGGAVTVVGLLLTVLVGMNWESLKEVTKTAGGILAMSGAINERFQVESTVAYQTSSDGKAIELTLANCALPEGVELEVHALAIASFAANHEGFQFEVDQVKVVFDEVRDMAGVVTFSSEQRFAFAIDTLQAEAAEATAEIADPEPSNGG